MKFLRPMIVGALLGAVVMSLLPRASAVAPVDQPVTYEEVVLWLDCAEDFSTDVDAWFDDWNVYYPAAFATWEFIVGPTQAQKDAITFLVNGMINALGTLRDAMNVAIQEVSDNLDSEFDPWYCFGKMKAAKDAAQLMHIQVHGIPPANGGLRGAVENAGIGLAGFPDFPEFGCGPVIVPGPGGGPGN